MRYNLGDIHHDKQGFSRLAQLNNRTKDCFLDEIEIDLHSTQWLDADMCSALGAVLHRLANDINSVHLTNMKPQVKRILSKNGFLSHYGHSPIPDQWGTTISFQRFDVTDFRFFAQYLENEFIRRSELPEMSPALMNALRISLFEIFNNSVQHANTHLGIFGCGQYYPQRHRLDFCLTDLGIGIHRNVCHHLGHDLDPEEAIHWATQERNTTKRGSIPGGLGLKLLSEFIDLNDGCLQIVSDAGYWRRQGRTIFKSKMTHPFPGTTVNLGINTSDQNSYQLSIEPDTDDIF